MATNFFERQDAARRNTKWLVLMFALAVIGIVGTTFLATALAFGAAAGEVPVEIPVAASVGALALIGGGSLYKIAQLAGGGTVVAERLGGRRVYPNTTDPTQRRLLNVVEEMALASGVPVPPVFLLSEEKSINAFAAGFSPSDAVVGVTRGCAEQLSRDELQGVVAHEFSHILNGDMRLNLRLIGVLHGILLMGLVGGELLRIAGRGGGRSRSRRNNGVAYLLVIGLVFLVIGFVGLFFGNLIKAAVSRQREFLADASAVQFTRNPGGIAGALKRIGAAVFGSRISNARAAEASHMYFAEGVSGLLATHPPINERIRRLDPQWDGKFPAALPAEAVVGWKPEIAAGFAGGEAVAGATVPVEVVQHAAQQVASPTEIHREYVHSLLSAIPQPVMDAVHDPYGARAVLFALLMDRDPQMRARQFQALERSADKGVYKLTHRLIAWIDELDVRVRLPLVDMALPALRAMSRPQFQAFARSFDGQVRADQRLGIFEWALHHILLRHLRPQFEPVRPSVVRYYGLQRLGDRCSVLLSALACASEHDSHSAFEAGARQLPEVTLRLLPAEDCRLPQLQVALEELALVAPKLRARLVSACAACICADSSVSIAEAELLRAVCDMLDCPMPPLLPGQQVLPALFEKPEHTWV
jgi:Zn-dependent protease with chaperone function